MCAGAGKGGRGTMRMSRGVLNVFFLAVVGLAARTAASDAQGRLTTKTYHGRSPPSLAWGAIDSPSLTRAVHCRGGRTAHTAEGAACLSPGKAARTVSPTTKAWGGRGWGQLRRSPEPVTELVPRGGGAASSQGHGVSKKAYRTALLRTCLLFISAGAFGLGTMVVKGQNAGLEFFAGYIVEQSLSVDNLFIFIMLFDYFKVPAEFQSRVLNWGIIGAVSMRAVMIVVGVAAIERFRWVMLFFAGILVVSSAKLLMEGEEDHGDSSQLENNAVLKIAKWMCDSTDYYDGEKFFTVVDGVKKATPLLLCLICIELTDFVFAVDSIPAVLGISHDTFIVYASNVFAICAMRSIYTLVQHAISDLPYLKPAVALVLGFVGAKMFAEFFHYEVSIGVSLSVVTGILAVGAVASIVSNRRRDAKAAAGVSGGGSEGLTFQAVAAVEEDLANAMPPAVTGAETEIVTGDVDVFGVPDAPPEGQQEEVDETRAFGSASNVEGSLASALEEGETQSSGEAEGGLDAAEGVFGGALSEEGVMGEGVGGTVEPLADAVAETVESVVGDGVAALEVEEGLSGYELGGEEEGSSPVEQEEGEGTRRGEDEEDGA